MPFSNYRASSLSRYSDNDTAGPPSEIFPFPSSLDASAAPAPLATRRIYEQEPPEPPSHFSDSERGQNTASPHFSRLSRVALPRRSPRRPPKRPPRAGDDKELPPPPRSYTVVRQSWIRRNMPGRMLSSAADRQEAPAAAGLGGSEPQPPADIEMELKDLSSNSGDGNSGNSPEASSSSSAAAANNVPSVFAQHSPIVTRLTPTPTQDSADTQQPPLEDEKIHPSLSRRHREYAFLFTVCMAQVFGQAGLGQTLAILHTMSDSFGTHPPGQVDLTWLIAGYTLALGACAIFAGRLGDVYGHKALFIAGFAWAFVWSVVAAVSFYSTPALLLFCRCMQGVGASLTLPNALALLGLVYPRGDREGDKKARKKANKKAFIFSVFAAVAPLGSIVGAVIASVLGRTWWPIAFYAFAFGQAVVAAVAYFTIPSLRSTPVRVWGFHAIVLELDIPGAVTAITALGLSCFAWFHGAAVGWPQATVWISLLAGLILMILFVLIEKFHATNPLVPFHAISWEVFLVLGVIGCGWACFGSWVFYTWQFLEQIRGVDPLLVAAQFTPILAVGVVAALGTGYTLSHTPPATVAAASPVAFAVGSLLMATIPVQQTYWTQTFLCMLIIGWGMYISFPAVTLMLSNAVESKHQGIAASLAVMAITYSSVLGLGIARTVESLVNSRIEDGAGVLRGYKAALYTGLGFALLGVSVSAALIWTRHAGRKHTCRQCRGLLNGHVDL